MRRRWGVMISWKKLDHKEEIEKGRRISKTVRKGEG
jgi:hypothetical protein